MNNEEKYTQKISVFEKAAILYKRFGKLSAICTDVKLPDLFLYKCYWIGSGNYWNDSFDFQTS